MDEEMAPPEGTPWWAKKLFLASAGLVAVIAFLGVYLALTRPDPAPPAGLPPAATTAPHGAGESRCQLPAGPQAISSDAPDTTWALVGRMAAPSSPTAGPGQVEDDGFRSCYARSPQGALLAAANNMVLSASPEHTVRATSELFAPGRGRDLLAQAQGRVSADELAQQVGQMPVMQIAGFRIEDYSQDQAIVTIVLRTQDGTLVGTPAVMQWLDGDWRWWLSDSGGAEVVALTSLAGFTTWAGAA